MLIAPFIPTNMTRAEKGCILDSSALPFIVEISFADVNSANLSSTKKPMHQDIVHTSSSKIVPSQQYCHSTCLLNALVIPFTC